MKPYRTDEYVHKLFYETARFSAFNQQWVVKARINNSQRDPHQSNERTITYQLILKTKTSTPMSIHFFALKGPFSDMKVSTQIYKHDFTETVCFLQLNIGFLLNVFLFRVPKVIIMCCPFRMAPAVLVPVNVIVCWPTRASISGKSKINISWNCNIKYCMLSACLCFCWTSNLFNAQQIKNF